MTSLTPYNVSTADLSRIVTEECVVDASMALRLARYFGTTPQFWLNLQTAYDLKITEREIGNRIKQEIFPLDMAQYL